MLLLNQIGSVKIGEVVRYTVTYTPSQDRILPSPERLFLRIRNTTTIAKRAAFVHGPYTLCVAAYPATFNPNEKFANARRYGVPEFEPMVKAGGSWQCELVVPDNIRQGAGDGVMHGRFGAASPDADTQNVSWIIEVSSQVIFSVSASVGYELVLARDEKSLSLGASIQVLGGNQAQVPQPGKVTDHQQSVGAKDGHHPAQPKGVFSRAITLRVEDTASLWNTPRLPGWDDSGRSRIRSRGGKDDAVDSVTDAGKKEAEQAVKDGKKKMVHLVILTHGLHSNMGADMLYMKESIDAAARQAKIDAKVRRAKEKTSQNSPSVNGEPSAGDSDRPPIAGSSLQDATRPDSTTDLDIDREDEDEDEEVIVRGFSGNATKTEKGIKYLGKRLARYVLTITYPDQPFLPAPKGPAKAFTDAFRSDPAGDVSSPSHKHSSIHHKADDRNELELRRRPYQIKSISFIGHSLGGLVQTYAVAYIQKHSPDFFDLIRPINFVALATPFLGLSNENPLYVKFALDFGLVGRTGQDLGLTWRPPTIARSGWGAIVGTLGETAHKRVMGENQSESKPLLRILPTGPAHTALKKFRNRTTYSNVVNDGIVPLRTSCLLFLDWQGLGRVDKARRDAGLVETVVGFGWAELTGTNMSSSRKGQLPPEEEEDKVVAESLVTSPPDSSTANSHEVPQPPTDATIEDDRASMLSVALPFRTSITAETADLTNPLTGFFSFFRKEEPTKSPPPSEKQKKMLKRGQTINFDEASVSSTPSTRSKVTTGQELEEDLGAPPKTSFFESARDLLNPRMAHVEYLVDPSRRPRTIFHDRVYHPSDIPAPPLKKRPQSLVRRRTINRAVSTMSTASSASNPWQTPSVPHQDSASSTKDYDDTVHTNPDKAQDEVIDSSNMRVEEKIARAYHRDLSWRKVLVKVEPDAHNNIVVRRMFANAFGWPIVKHLVDNHFSDKATARMRVDEEENTERALDVNLPPDEYGGETKSTPQNAGKPITLQIDKENKDPLLQVHRTESEMREAEDKVTDLPHTPGIDSSRDKLLHAQNNSPDRPGFHRYDSVTWSERDWMDSENESEMDHEMPQSPASKSGVTSDAEDEATAGPIVPTVSNTDGPGPLTSGWNWAEKIVGKGAFESLKATKSHEEVKDMSQQSSQSAAEDGSPSEQRSKSPLLGTDN